MAWKDYVAKGGSTGFKARGSLKGSTVSASSYRPEGQTASQQIRQIRETGSAINKPATVEEVKNNGLTQEAFVETKAPLREPDKLVGVDLFEVNVKNDGSLSRSPTGVSLVREKVLDTKRGEIVYEQQGAFKSGVERVVTPFESSKVQRTYSNYPRRDTVTGEVSESKVNKSYVETAPSESFSVLPKYRGYVRGDEPQELFDTSKNNLIAPSSGGSVALDKFEFNLKQPSYFAAEKVRALRESNQPSLSTVVGVRQVGSVVRGGYEFAVDTPRNFINIGTGGANPASKDFGRETVTGEAFKTRGVSAAKFAEAEIGGKLISKLPSVKNEVIVFAGRKEYIPETKVFETKGGEVVPFSTTRSVEESLSSFNKNAKDGKVEVMHVSQGTVKAGVVQAGSSADTGLYVSPKNRASSYFTGIKPENNRGYSFSLLPKFDSPTVSVIETGKVQRIPKSELGSGFDRSNLYLKSQAGSGSPYITRRSELAFNPSLMTSKERILERSKAKVGGTSLATTEAEAVIPEGTMLTRVKEGFGGFKEYTRFEGRVVPLKKYKAEPVKGNAVDFETPRVAEEIKLSDVRTREALSSKRTFAPTSINSFGASSSLTTGVSSNRFSAEYSGSGRVSGVSELASSKQSFQSSKASGSSSGKPSAGYSYGKSTSYSPSYSQKPSSSYSERYSGSSEYRTPIDPVVRPGPSLPPSFADTKNKGKSKTSTRKYGYSASFAVYAGEKFFDLDLKNQVKRGFQGRFSGFEVRGFKKGKEKK